MVHFTYKDNMSGMYVPNTHRTEHGDKYEVRSMYACMSRPGQAGRSTDPTDATMAHDFGDANAVIEVQK